MSRKRTPLWILILKVKAETSGHICPVPGHSTSNRTRRREDPDVRAFLEIVGEGLIAETSPFAES